MFILESVLFLKGGIAVIEINQGNTFEREIQIIYRENGKKWERTNEIILFALIDELGKIILHKEADENMILKLTHEETSALFPGIYTCEVSIYKPDLTYVATPIKEQFQVHEVKSNELISTVMRIS